MRNVFITASALCGLAAAAPQLINIEAANAVPTPTVLGPKVEETAILPVTYNQPAAAASAANSVATAGVEVKIRKRAACDLQPGGAGPVPGAGKVEDYTDYNSQLRKNARGAKAPSTYTEVFQDKLASTEQIGYLTYKNIDSGLYDVGACADFCNSEQYCLGFNIYYERDPKQEPGSNCANPDPITNVKCSIYGYPIAYGTATNQGQYREQFHVVITGSNGYSKINPSCKAAPVVAHFQAPVNLPAAINAPLIKKNGQDYDTYNGMRLFNANPFDPSLCAAACESQTAFDKQHLVDANGNYKPCNFFTAYVLTKNGVPLGTYCALYTQAWDSTYAVNTGYSDGSDVYRVTCAASYTATTIDSGMTSSPAQDKGGVTD